MELSTSYLGLNLKNPFIVGACPLTDSASTVQELEENGAAAVVLPSLYQERSKDQTSELPSPDMVYAQAWSTGADPNALRSPFSPKQYLKTLEHIKSKVAIPVIGSISCTSLGDWTEYAGMIRNAGADALELNIYSVTTDPAMTSGEVEQRIIEIVSSVRQGAQIPLAVKLSPFYTALPNLVCKLTKAGAKGLVLFTRTYQSDINVLKRAIAPNVQLSQITDHAELLLRLRWMALLSPWTTLSLALSGGVHTGMDAMKGIMAGAHVIQVVSALLNVGPKYMHSLIEQFEEQMRQTKAASLCEIRGCLNAASEKDPGATERADYVRTLHSWPLHHGQATFLRSN